MRRVLLISNEIGIDDPGIITGSEFYGLPKDLENIPHLVQVLHSLTECNIQVVHHTRLHEILNPEYDCVVLSGFFPGHGFSDDALRMEFADEIQFIRNCQKPLLGICLGIQLIGLAYGGSTSPMANGTGEHGSIRLHLKKSHPILEGFDADTMWALVLHSRELTAVPPGFDLLLSGEQCPIQMMACRNRPLFGVQFHPEMETSEKQGISLILKNFMHISS